MSGVTWILIYLATWSLLIFSHTNFVASKAIDVKNVSTQQEVFKQGSIFRSRVSFNESDCNINCNLLTDMFTQINKINESMFNNESVVDDLARTFPYENSSFCSEFILMPKHPFSISNDSQDFCILSCYKINKNLSIMIHNSCKFLFIGYHMLNKFIRSHNVNETEIDFSWIRKTSISNNDPANKVNNNLIQPRNSQIPAAVLVPNSKNFNSNDGKSDNLKQINNIDGKKSKETEEKYLIENIKSKINSNTILNKTPENENFNENGENIKTIVKSDQDLSNDNKKSELVNDVTSNNKKETNNNDINPNFADTENEGLNSEDGDENEIVQDDDLNTNKQMPSDLSNEDLVKPDKNKLLVDPFVENSDSSFFTYFLFLMFVCMICYIIYHNKAKILGLIVEGRRSSHGRSSGRRKHTAAYSKLDSNLEEAIASGNLNNRSQQIIY